VGQRDCLDELEKPLVALKVDREAIRPRFCMHPHLTRMNATTQQNTDMKNPYNTVFRYTQRMLNASRQ
jgi:hypothetical protein